MFRHPRALAGWLAGGACGSVLTTRARRAVAVLLAIACRSVFGKVIDGMLTVRRIENVATGPNNKPKLPVVISQCGEL